MQLPTLGLSSQVPLSSSSGDVAAEDEVVRNQLVAEQLVDAIAGAIAACSGHGA